VVHRAGAPPNAPGLCTSCALPSEVTRVRVECNAQVVRHPEHEGRRRAHPGIGPGPHTPAAVWVANVVCGRGRGADRLAGWPPSTRENMQPIELTYGGLTRMLQPILAWGYLGAMYTMFNGVFDWTDTSWHTRFSNAPLPPAFPSRYGLLIL
jgi:hypothetical protein